MWFEIVISMVWTIDSDQSGAVFESESGVLIIIITWTPAQPEMQHEAVNNMKSLPKHDPGHPSGGTAPEGLF